MISSFHVSRLPSKTPLLPRPPSPHNGASVGGMFQSKKVFNIQCLLWLEGERDEMRGQGADTGEQEMGIDGPWDIFFILFFREFSTGLFGI